MSGPVRHTQARERLLRQCGLSAREAALVLAEAAELGRAIARVDHDACRIIERSALDVLAAREVRR